MSGYKDRRDFLKHAGLMGSVAMMAGMPDGALALGGIRGPIIEDAVIAPAAQAEETPKHHIKFAVCGMSHDHIYGMIGAGGQRRSRFTTETRRARRTTEERKTPCLLRALRVSVVTLPSRADRQSDVDGRVKPGHDGFRWSA